MVFLFLATTRKSYTLRKHQKHYSCEEIGKSSLIQITLLKESTLKELTCVASHLCRLQYIHRTIHRSLGTSSSPVHVEWPVFGLSAASARGQHACAPFRGRSLEGYMASLTLGFSFSLSHLFELQTSWWFVYVKSHHHLGLKSLAWSHINWFFFPSWYFHPSITLSWSQSCNQIHVYRA